MDLKQYGFRLYVNGGLTHASGGHPTSLAAVTAMVETATLEHTFCEVYETVTAPGHAPVSSVVGRLILNTNRINVKVGKPK